MRKGDLQFIHNTLYVKQLLQEPSMNKTAQVQDFVSGVFNDVKDKVKGLNSPEAFLSFLVPGAFWTLGFKKLSVIFAIAEALGFDFTKFLSSIRTKISSIVHDLYAGKEADSGQIQSIVESSAQEATTDNVNVEKAEEAMQAGNISESDIVKTQSLQELKELEIIVLAAGGSIKDRLVDLSESMLGRRAKTGIIGMIVRVFSFVLSAMFISLGFSVVGSIASRILKPAKDAIIGPSESKDNKEDSENQKETLPKVTTKLVPNPSADPSMFHTSYNDEDHVWILHSNISSIKDQLIDWAQDMYLNLTDRAAFDQSPYFKDILKKFQDRNKNSQVQMVAVPTPFTSIKEIVDSFAADVASKTKDQNAS